MIKIIKYDNICQIVNEDDVDRQKALDFYLSYKIKGAEHSKAYKGYINDRGEEVTWDGRKHLMKSNMKFPIGLLNRVCDFYTAKEIKYEIIDERKNVSLSNPIDISHNLKKINIEPRYYQVDAAEAAINVNRGIIRAGTGAGKTLIAALIVAKLGKPSTIMVIGKDLLYQFHKFFSSIFDEKIGIIGDGRCEIHRINICTIWSVGKAIGFDATVEDCAKEKEVNQLKKREIKQMLLDSNVIILDEAHLAACETVQSIGHNVKAEHFYGMSASPWRDDGADMLIEAILGRKIVDISAKYLIEKGFLVKPAIRFLAVPKLDGIKNAKYNTVYKKYIVDNEIRNGMVCTAAERLVEQGFQTLVLFKTKNHGKKLYKMLSGKIKCALLDGDDEFKAREIVCNQLTNGEINCIIASTIFDIGIDLPALSALVNGGGGSSSTRALQRIGRILRKYEGKTIAPVIDLCDQAPYLMQHSEARKSILETEFEVSWPKKKE